MATSVTKKKVSLNCQSYKTLLGHYQPGLCVARMAKDLSSCLSDALLYAFSTNLRSGLQASIKILITLTPVRFPNCCWR